MLASNLLKNISPDESVSPADLTKRITQEARIFEDAIVRE
jgi:hypothetical protein